MFGRNGAGKSTISNTISDASRGELEPDISLSLVDAQGNACTVERDILDSTYVFNEAYVERNVKVKSSGLDAILLLGEAGEYSEEIARCKEEQEQLANKLELLIEQEKEFASASGDKSLSKAKVDLLTGLKGDSRWAERDKRIKQGINNSRVTEQRLSEVSVLALPNRKLSELYADFESKLQDYLQLKNNPNSELPPVPQFDSQLIDSSSLENFQVLLSTAVEKPQLSERDKRILEIVEKYGNGFVETALGQLESKELGYCPYCYRDIDDESVNEIAVAVSNVLNKRVEQHQEALQSMIIPKFFFDTSAYEEIFPELCLRLIDSQNLYNEETQKANGLLEQKKQRVYTPLTFDTRPAENAKTALCDALEDLRNSVNIYNSELKRMAAKLKTLNELNCQIARIEIDPLLKKHSALLEKRDTIKAEIKSTNEELELNKNRLAELEARKQNIYIGLELINAGLSFIFMDSDHLRLDGSSGEYRLLSHGVAIPPSSVSSGERNAIGLCYFFSCIGQGHSEKDRFSHPLFLLIDDPISSFDYENKIGIITYLRRQFERALSDNEKTKILVMTHDYQTMQNLGRIYNRDIIPAYKARNEDTGKKLPKEKAFVLDRGCLSPWNAEIFDYSSMLNELYQYANSPSRELRPYIGNVARKVLESFSTFEYQKGLDAYTSSPKVLNRINDEYLREYFNGYMSRIILHDESHLEEAVRGESSLITFNRYSDIELTRAVRDAVVLLFCLNREHVLSHLGQADAETTIERWIVDMRPANNKNAVI